MTSSPQLPFEPKTRRAMGHRVALAAARSRLVARLLAFLLVSFAVVGGASTARAQGYGPPGGYPPTPGYPAAPTYGQPCPPGQFCGGAGGQVGPGGGYGGPGYGGGGYGGPGYGGGGYGGGAYGAPQSKDATGLEKGFLYGTAAAWGVGAGVWIDAEAEVEEPAVALIAPAILGVAAPIGVFIADRVMNDMPRGLPSALASGILLGAGTGISIAGLQAVTASGSNAWEFRDFMRAEVIASTVGGALGGVSYAFLRPSPKSNVLVLSGGLWGAGVGAAFGGGASDGSLKKSDDYIMLGEVIGLGAGTAITGGLSTFWVPSWDQLAWMWGGFGIGVAVASPAYIVYAATDGDPRRALIFQGVAGLLGLGIGALAADWDDPPSNASAPQAMFALQSFGVVPTANGVSAFASGTF